MSTLQIIAEAGVNHNGDILLAEKLIEVAKTCGANWIKFQAFSPEHLVKPTAEKAPYQLTDDPTHNQFEMLKKYSFSYEQLEHLKNVAEQNQIGFLCSVFDLVALSWVEKLKIPVIKVPSGEIDHLVLLENIARLKLPVWLSTGISSTNEIKRAIEILIGGGSPPSELVLLHCHTEYPTQYSDANLLAIPALRNQFGLPVGYSDHTEGFICAVAAVTLGACIVEKHFTLDRTLPGPDHKASLDPNGFKELTTAINDIRSALGDGIKTPKEAELKNKTYVRKSIYVSRPVQEGELFTADNLICLRPATGKIGPEQWHLILGSRAKRSYKLYEAID